MLVYPWVVGEVLNAATVVGSDRSGPQRFRTEPVAAVRDSITRVLHAHAAIAAVGFVAVDFCDGCLLYDFGAAAMRLIDLDNYRPGPFTLSEDRLAGSTSYMAPEEFQRGAIIDERTNVFSLGRTIHHLLDSVDGWRGTPAQSDVAVRATYPDPDARHPSVAELGRAWAATVQASTQTRERRIVPASSNGGWWDAE